MNDNIDEIQVTQTAASVAVPIGEDPVACLRKYEPQAYRAMNSEQQNTALQQVVDETAEAIRRVRADERWHFAERCHRIGLLLIHARRNLDCVWSGGYRGTALLDQISSRCGICTRTLEYYSKLAALIDPVQVDLMAKACLPWLEIREILNMAGHGVDDKERVADAMRHLPASGEREARRPFTAWLKERHLERNPKKELKALLPDGSDQPGVPDNPQPAG